VIYLDIRLVDAILTIAREMEDWRIEAATARRKARGGGAS